MDSDSDESGSDGGFLAWDHTKREIRRRESLETDDAAKTTKNAKNSSRYGDDEDDASTFENDEDSSTSDEESGSGSSYYSTDSDDNDEEGDDTSSSKHKTGWSVRVRILEVENLPSQLTPSVPFCPVFKFGLISSTKQTIVRLPQPQSLDVVHPSINTGTDGMSSKKVHDTPSNSTSHQDLSIEEKLQLFGLSRIKNARGRSSSNAILTVKNSLKFEWQEEFRWNSVARPLQTLLAIELCGKSLFLKESSPSISTTTYLKPTAKPLSTSTSMNLSASLRSSRYLHSPSLFSPESLPTINTLANLKKSNNSGTHNYYSNAEFDNKNESAHPNNEPRNPLASLWRRGRQTLHRSAVANPGLLLSQSGHNSLYRTYNHGAGGGTGLNVLKPAEVETASAAETVARFLLQDSKNTGENYIHNSISESATSTNHGDSIINDTSSAMTKKFQDDFQLGSLLIPLSQLPLEDATVGIESSEKRHYAVIDKWFPIGLSTGITPKQNPTPSSTNTNLNLSNRISRIHHHRHPQPKLPGVRLEISFASTQCLDDSEDDFTDSDDDEDDDEDEDNNESKQKTKIDDNDMYSVSVCSTSTRRSSVMKEKLRRRSSQRYVKAGNNKDGTPLSMDPLVEPGIVDFICVIGAKGTGDLNNDDGALGWVKVQPEFSIYEQFPKDDEFHIKNGREVALPNKIEWFCFPEECKLWRGLEPPTARDLELTGNEHRRPTSLNTSEHSSHILQRQQTFVSNELFDKCLDCTTTFSWFVIASTSESYGSKTVKTYGAAIRFYAPAPCGIDPTMDDFAQISGNPGYDILNSSQHHKLGNSNKRASVTLKRVRLWVPMCICVTSSFPIVGILEGILLRICQSIGSKQLNQRMLHDDLANLIINFQAPIPGVLHCSIPFLNGQRFHVTLPPSTGLPQLPHGGCVTRMCKLIGAKGLVELLAAVLTECKIILHSKNVSNLAMAGEVITALIFPFRWELPYIPVLPKEMLEFAEAPMSFMVGIASSGLKYIDKEVLSDIFVFDLDNFNSPSENSDLSEKQINYKKPSPLPAYVSSGISNEVLKLLKEAEDVEMQYGVTTNPLPRLEPEDLAEREFRISVSLYVSSLIRGYYDCLFFVSSSQPVFNRERFLRTGDALFEEKRDMNGGIQRAISERSKEFLMRLINTQSFHCMLERLYSDDGTFPPFFHEIMDALDLSDDNRGADAIITRDFARAMVNQLNNSLQKVEDAIPTYRVYRKTLNESDSASGFEEEDIISEFGVEDTPMVSFTSKMLQPIEAMQQAQLGRASENGARRLNIEILVEIDKKPWDYNKLFDICNDNDKACQLRPKITIREGIGEVRYRSYLASQKNDTKGNDSDENANLNNLFINNLLSSAKDDTKKSDMSSPKPNSTSAKDTQDREILRRCLERAYRGSPQSSSNNGVGNNSSMISFIENGRDLIAEAEMALRNKSAQKFLLSLLSQRARLEKQRQRRQTASGVRAVRPSIGTSRILPSAFRCLVRLCNAMLEAAMIEQDFESAYRLLTHTYGFFTIISGVGVRQEKKTIFMTAKIGMHPIFTDLCLWEKVIEIHEDESNSALANNNKSEKSKGMVAYDATIATLYEMAGYGVPTEELVRFVTRVSNSKGWFATDKAHSLLALVRKLSVNRENEVSDDSTIPNNATAKNDENTWSVTDSLQSLNISESLRNVNGTREIERKGFAWFHPVAQSDEMLGSNSGHGITKIEEGIDKSTGTNQAESDHTLTPIGYEGKSPITSVTCFGASAIITGSLDGGVFLSYKHTKSEVKGVRLQWGNSQKSTGSVSCLASVRTAEHQSSHVSQSLDLDIDSEEEFSAATDGCSIVAASAGGEINVWSLKEVYQSLRKQKQEDGNDIHQIDSVFPISQNKMESALKGRSLPGHTGGVSCIDVPSTVYRPDSLVSGGEDGLIKLWSLRNSHIYEEEKPSKPIRANRFFGVKSFLQPEIIPNNDESGDAQAVLSGHEGKVLCIKTAWHGDRLLSGGTDGKVMLWDLAGSDGKCLQEMIGHILWVTHTQYWGPHTIVSASTDRTVALWDARAAGDPLFILRHHNSHISDILLGSRTDPLMVTAGGDGTLATWDLRTMTSSMKSSRSTRTKTNRQPLATMNHSEGRNCSGSILLTRGASSTGKSVISAGTDGVIKEWDVSSGRNLGANFYGHRDGISCMTSFSNNDELSVEKDVKSKHGLESSRVCGIITCSWDGSVRLRRVFDKRQH